MKFEWFNKKSEHRDGEPQFEFGAYSVPKRPEEPNGDNCFISREHMTVGVCDGVGSCDDPRAASATVTQSLQEAVERIQRNEPPEAIGAHVTRALLEANDRLREMSVDKFHDASALLTTAVVAIVARHAEALRVVTASVGDSRAYKYSSRTKKISQLTCNFLLPDVPREEDPKKRTPRMIQHELAHITSRAQLDQDQYLNEEFVVRNNPDQLLGDEKIEPLIQHEPVEIGDVILCCSDGIHDTLTDEEIQNILMRDEAPETLARMLVEAAQHAVAEERRHIFHHPNERKNIRAKSDDMTAVVIKI